jgi:single-strand selective monofunctional uracil DNA glycosylase
MAQTGVPFGEVALARDWLGIDGRVGKPANEHPNRPIEGFACRRSEVSGQRLWGWAKQRFGRPERFFERFFVWNYCPLVFMEQSGRNRTPDKLAAEERAALYAACDRALHAVARQMAASTVVGIGAFAMARARAALANLELPIGGILHPSPASPLANSGWAERAEQDLARLCIALD